MEITVNVKDNKAPHLLEVLKGLSFVTSTTVAAKRRKPISRAKTQLVDEIKEAVEELKLIKAGKKKAQNFDDFLKEL